MKEARQASKMTCKPPIIKGYSAKLTKKVVKLQGTSAKQREFSDYKPKLKEGPYILMEANSQ